MDRDFGHLSTLAFIDSLDEPETFSSNVTDNFGHNISLRTQIFWHIVLFPVSVFIGYQIASFLMESHF